MNKFLGIIGFFACISCTSLAQVYKKSSATHLYTYPGSVASISWDGNKYVFPADTPFINMDQHLIKNNNGLYTILDGSGRLYKASLKNNQPVFERIDSTTYFGSNFHSFIFSFRDTIYSLGGYGFWKTNGLLRYYLEQRHEWEIMKLNKEIPLKTGETHDLIWYDQASGKLYFGFTKEGPGTTTDTESKNELHFETQVLDLVKKEWQQVGILSSFLKNDLTSVANIASSPFGQMIAFGNKNLFLDYANNKVYRLSDAKQREIEQLPTSTGNAHVNYFIDSTFYSWLTEKDLVDSLKIDKKDLVLLDEKIYTTTPHTVIDEKSSSNSMPVILIIAGLAAFIPIGYYFWKKRSRLPGFPGQLDNNGHITDNTNDFIIAFTPLEIEVIQVVFENSSKGAYTSIEELNKALGVSKKNNEIQKKQRSDIITAINKRYSYIKRSNQELIEKKRTEFDKRSFEYFIDPSRLTDAGGFIKSAGSSIQS